MRKTFSTLAVLTLLISISSAWGRGGDKGSDISKNPSAPEEAVQTLHRSLMFNDLTTFTQLLQGDAFDTYGNNLEQVIALQKSGLGLPRANLEISVTPNTTSTEEISHGRSFYIAVVNVVPKSYEHLVKKFEIKLDCSTVTTIKCWVRNIKILES